MSRDNAQRLDLESNRPAAILDVADRRRELGWSAVKIDHVARCAAPAEPPCTCISKTRRTYILLSLSAHFASCVDASRAGHASLSKGSRKS